MKQLKALVIDDSVFKASDIGRALEAAGVGKIEKATHQAKAWDLIYASLANNEPYDLIVTDMHYPLEGGWGVESDPEAGFKLIEQMKKEGINIPTIICSSHNFQTEDIFGSVWYAEQTDLRYEFHELVQKLREFKGGRC